MNGLKLQSVGSSAHREVSSADSCIMWRQPRTTPEPWPPLGAVDCSTFGPGATAISPLCQRRESESARGHEMIKHCLKSCSALLLLCVVPVFAQSELPNPRLTPGTVNRGITIAEICTVGYSRHARFVSLATKRRVYAEYGMPQWITGEHELDPLELGGSNGIKNLWPEPNGTYWNAKTKDALEDRLHTMVCRGDMPREEARRMIATDWIGAYKRIFHVSKPIYRQRIREHE
jgi:hypothetical protein